VHPKVYQCVRKPTTAAYIPGMNNTSITLNFQGIYCTINLFLYKLGRILMIFQVLMAKTMKMTDFWDIASCNLVEINWHFSGTCRLHHHGLITLVKEVVSMSEISAISTRLQGTTSQKTAIFKVQFIHK
jgi:hypothetical protein